MSRHNVSAHPHEGAAAGVLREDVQTRYGVFTAGLPVLVLEIVEQSEGRKSLIVCLDNGAHLGQCHVTAVRSVLVKREQP